VCERERERERGTKRTKLNEQRKKGKKTHRRILRGALRVVQARLNQVLAFSLGDQRLQLRGGEGVNMACFRGHQQQHLSPGQRAQLVGLVESHKIKVSPQKGIECGRRRNLLHDASLPLAKGDVPAALVLDELNVDLPATTLPVLVFVAVFLFTVIGLLALLAGWLT